MYASEAAKLGSGTNQVNDEFVLFRNPYLFEHKQNHLFHLAQGLSPELCQSHATGGICLSLLAASIENRIFQVVYRAGNVDRFGV